MSLNVTRVHYYAGVYVMYVQTKGYIYVYIRYRHTSASVLGSHLYAICCYVHLQRLGFIDGWSRTLSSPSLMAKTRSIITCAHFKKKKRAALSLSHTILLLVCDFCLSANQK